MKRQTVLIVDDNATTRKLVRVILKRYEILEAGDGAQALEVLASQAPNLIIQDLRLPDVDGIELMRQMRRLPNGQAIPILAFSGLFSKIQEAGGVLDGFSDYIFKPIDPASLRSIVETYLPSAAQAAQPNPERTLLIVNDDPRQCKLLKASFERAGLRVITAAQGQEGLEQARRHRPAGILSDILMPGLDGFQLCLQVRRDPALTQIPVMLLSVVQIGEEDQLLARQIGAAGLLSRPARQAELVEQVLSILDQPAPPSEPEPREALPEEYTHRLIRQLEEQSVVNTSLWQRLARRKAELAVFSSMLESITPEGEIETLLDQALQQCLDACGGSLGAIYLGDERGELQLRVQFGFGPRQQRELQHFFGERRLLEQVVEQGQLLMLSARGDDVPDEQRALLKQIGCETLLLIPIVIPSAVRGVLVGAPGHAHVGDDWLEFLSLLGRQMGRMIHEVRAVADLRQSEEQYRSLVEASPDAIIMTDLAGTILFGNQRSALLYACARPEDLLGRIAAETLVPEDRERIRTTMEQLLASQQPQSGAYTLQRDNGRTCPVEISSSLMLDRQGQPRSMLHFARDISERLEAEASKRAQEAAERANQAKSEFLSRMSHELRTPLNAILGFAQIMQLGDLSARHREGVDYILKAGHHLLAMINEVLELSRIEAGKLSTSPEPIAVGEIVAQALDLISPLAQQRDIDVICEIDLTAERYVLADRQRLLQVLLNLLSNSVKYNRDGGSIEVSIGPERPGEPIQISIGDTGIGIPRSRMAELFVPFQRLGAEHSRVEGTGLGLALSKRLLEEMQGQIGVESEVGQGSRFWITLPSVDGPLAQARGQPLEPEAARGDERPTTVLLIEDNFANYRLIEHILATRPAINLLGAQQARLGLSLAREHPIELILLDLHLPDMPGSEVLQRLQSDPATRHIPVIVLSADARPEQQERLLKDGAYAYLTKPLDVRQFLGLVDRVVAARSE